ncbi:MAG: tetratricopeptide repeat protein, partial [Ginsengibacter sp.]
CMALHGLGKDEEAVEAIQSAVVGSARHQYPLFVLSWIYAMIDNIAGAQKILDELIMRSKTEFISGLSLAVAAYHSQNYDMAFEFLEQAFDEKASLLISMSGYPFLSFIKTDPRFHEFYKRMNYPDQKI